MNHYIAIYCNTIGLFISTILLQYFFESTIINTIAIFLLQYIVHYNIFLRNTACAPPLAFGGGTTSDLGRRQSAHPTASPSSEGTLTSTAQYQNQ